MMQNWLQTRDLFLTVNLDLNTELGDPLEGGGSN